MALLVCLSLFQWTETISVSSCGVCHKRTQGKTIHGREPRVIRKVRAEKLAKLKFYFSLIK